MRPKRAGGRDKRPQDQGAPVGAPPRPPRPPGRPMSGSRLRRRGRGDRPRVYGDATYGSGKSWTIWPEPGSTVDAKSEPPVAEPGGRYSKTLFYIDLDAGAVHLPHKRARSPSDGTRPTSPHRLLRIGLHRLSAPLRLHQRRPGADRHQSAATKPFWPTSPEPHTTEIGQQLPRHPTEDRTETRSSNATPTRRPTSKTTRTQEGDTKLNLLAAAHNLARLATLGIRSGLNHTWAIA